MVECTLELLGWNMASSVPPPLGYRTSLVLRYDNPATTLTNSQILSNRGHISSRNLKSPSSTLSSPSSQCGGM